MAKKQFYGIKYPFTSQDEENYFLDLNNNNKEKIKSLLIHIVFTPKGQKIRDPEFGTNLIKFIYEPNDDQTWSRVKNEINEVVSNYLDGIYINDVSILQSDGNSHDVMVKLDYTITNGIYKETDNLITKI